ncbi:helix-turn-helix protein [Micromonospora sp. Llam0]|uniref:helix-turn-helix domain-containing protein n=1 Tax=Micromonospora sp. Llam0 TaxID=2485143 RepID=UPI000F46FB68|nr:helix-turn-helix transcriptional regulator [Micromonospora sp. Llam0]ROO52904.1 helix-turn-helix protein [Micromonospora sp. Llam0]
MSPSVLNSSVPRRRLGRELRQLRERLTQLPQTSVASELEWSATKLWRMERGEVPVRSGDVVLLCELYGVDEETTEILAALATKSPGLFGTPRRRENGGQVARRRRLFLVRVRP